MKIQTDAIGSMFMAIMQRKQLPFEDGVLFQHESFFNGQYNRLSIRCKDFNTGHLLWQVWTIPGRRLDDADKHAICVNRSFSVADLKEARQYVVFDPQKMITASPDLPNIFVPDQPRPSIAPGYASGQIGMPQPGFYGPGDGPYEPFRWSDTQPLPRMDQIGSASRSAMFMPNMADRAKLVRASLLTRFGVEETNRLISAMLHEIANPDKWLLNETSDEVFFRFYGDGKFDSARDRVIALKQIREVLVAQGYIVDNINVEEFVVTVRLP